MTLELIRDAATGRLVRDATSGKLQRAGEAGITICVYCDPDATPLQLALTITGLVDCPNCLLIFGGRYRVFGIAAVLNNTLHVLNNSLTPPNYCHWGRSYTPGYFGTLSVYSDASCTVKTGDIPLDYLVLGVSKTSPTSIMVDIVLRATTGPVWLQNSGVHAFWYSGSPVIVDCIATVNLPNQLDCYSAVPFVNRACSSGLVTIVEGPAVQTWYQTRLPTGDASVQWDPVANNYSYVDDPPDTPDDDGSYTYTSDGWDKDYFNFTGFNVPAGSTITNVQAVGRFKRIDAGGSFLARLLLRINGVTHYGPSEQFVFAYETRTATWATNPATGLAWTVDDANGIGANPLQQFGYECMGFKKGVRCTQVYMKVNYQN